MAKNIIMPKAGNTVESCVIATINVKEGDKVNVGDVLFSYETDKTSIEEVSEVAGTVLKVLHAEDDEVPVFDNVMIIGEPGEDISEFLSGSATSAPEASAPEAKVEEVVSAPVQTEVTQVKSDSDLNISPRAQRLMDELDVKENQITTASGVNERVMEADIMAAKENTVVSPAPAAPVTATTAAVAPQVSGEESYKVEYSGVRKAIAKGMNASLKDAAQLTLHTTFDATNLMALREMIKSNGEKLGLENINLNDMITFAVSRVVPKYPLLNSQVGEDHVIAYNVAHIATAVETEKGLMVPVLKNADSMSLNEMAKELRTLFAETKEGKLSPAKMSGGSFTVSNMGSLGVYGFTPVINRPQAAILGVGGLETKVKMVAGEVKPYQAMHLSLTFDHMPVDGMYAGRLLNELCATLENFSLALLK